MVLFHTIKHKLMWNRFEPVCSGSVISRLIDVEPGDSETSLNITAPVPAPLNQHWDNALADTVPVVGCQCTFCSLRPTQEAIERGWRKRQARVVSQPVRGLPPRSSVLEILYGFPSSDSPRGDSVVSSSTGNMGDTHRHPLPSGVQDASSHLPGIHRRASAPPPYSKYDTGITDNQSIPPNNYGILGPYLNPSNAVYRSTPSD